MGSCSKSELVLLKSSIEKTSGHCVTAIASHLLPREFAQSATPERTHYTGEGTGSEHVTQSC